MFDTLGNMFEAVLEGLVGMTDSELDHELRASELVRRQHAARHAALVAVAEHRRIHQTDGHRSMASYLRGACNASGSQITLDRKLARLLDAQPGIGDALYCGRIGIGHAAEIARILGNPRIAHLLPLVVGVFVEQAEHRSYDDFRGDIDAFVTLADQDGAFAELAGSVEHRTARVDDIGGAIDMVACGGDPVTVAQMVAVFESFVEGEYRADVDARRERYGDEADQHPLPRTPTQRRFDALTAIFAAAAASPEGRALPEPITHIVIDHRSLHEAFAHAAIALPNGNIADVEAIGDDTTMLTTLAHELLDDPEAFRSRRCETATGAAIHPIIALRAALTGHIRRVVVDSEGVVIDYGTKQRLFTGHARAAAMLLATTCTHPGCRVSARLCEVDHMSEWHEGGRTEQRNGAIRCGGHNRFKHRERWTTRRDRHGRIYNIRADGTIVLPVGERAPDLSPDELAEITRSRLATLAL
jgi:hypothetical protein